MFTFNTDSAGYISLKKFLEQYQHKQAEDDVDEYGSTLMSFKKGLESFRNSFSKSDK